MWLAQVGCERIDETADPELAIERALETYLKKEYSQDWINQRLKTIEVRKILTDEWDLRGVSKGLEYAILTDEITERGKRLRAEKIELVLFRLWISIRDAFTPRRGVNLGCLVIYKADLEQLSKVVEFDHFRALVR